MSLLLLTHLSMPGVHMDSLAHFIQLLDAPLLTELTLSVHRWDLRLEDSSEELTELLQDTSFTHRLTVLNLQSLAPFADDNSFFRYFENIQTLRLNFRYKGLDPSFWDTLANLEHGGLTFLPNLQNLSLAAVPAGHAQELVYLCEHVQQPRLKLLELVFFRAEDVLNARSPAWSTWLSSHIDTLVVPPHVQKFTRIANSKFCIVNEDNLRAFLPFTVQPGSDWPKTGCSEFSLVTCKILSFHKVKEPDFIDVSKDLNNTTLGLYSFRILVDCGWTAQKVVQMDGLDPGPRPLITAGKANRKRPLASTIAKVAAPAKRRRISTENNENVDTSVGIMTRSQSRNA
ncbi:hypothetical protein DFH06DRAFT_1153683 [Mycena polygramma]|nr:hypothetical protein DFH06DRAFT_1153683 [Mycena polygramma]